VAIIIHVRSPVCAAISIKPTSCHGSFASEDVGRTSYPPSTGQSSVSSIQNMHKLEVHPLFRDTQISKYCLSHYMSPQDTIVCGATHSHFQTPSVEKQNGGSWGRDFCFKTLTKYWYLQCLVLERGPKPTFYNKNHLP